MSKLLIDRARNITSHISNVSFQMQESSQALASYQNVSLTHQTNLQDLQKIQLLFKQISSHYEESSRLLFTNIINFGLNLIFEGKVFVKLEITPDSRGTFYKYLLVKEGVEEDLLSSGGGILDIISFLNRLVVIVNFYKPAQRVVFLDEPFKNLSKRYMEIVPTLLSALSKEFSIQFIVITHKKELLATASNIFEIKKLGQTTSFHQTTNKP